MPGWVAAGVFILLFFLSFYPALQSRAEGRPAGGWLVAGLLLGPFAGLIYLGQRSRRRSG